MTDIADTWALAEANRHRLPNPLPAPFTGALPFVASLLGALPVRDHGPGFWEPLPIEDAPRSSWRVIIACRAGCEGDDMSPAQAVYEARGHPDPTAWLRRRAMMRNLVLPAAIGWDIVDLLAVRPRQPGAIARLTGMADALGDADMFFARLGDPVPIARDLADWVARFHRGSVLPLGTPTEQTRYLRACDGGIVAADVPHGERLLAAMQRPVPPLPPLFVQAAQ